MKKVIIVGATSGIGKEMAKIYAEKNYTVGITGRRNELLNELKQQYPEQMITSCFDVTGNDNQQHIQQLIQNMDGLDLLIYNSGYGDTSLQLDWEIERTTTQTNVNGFVEIVTHAFNYFVEKGGGQIAVISSVAALRGNSWAPAYSASKAFISNYAEGLNVKAKKLQIDIVITDIRPGFIDTKLAKGYDRFWVASPLKAAKQIVKAIAEKKRVAYITKRWWFVAQIFKWLPFWLYRKLF
jgi:short-subunit dehydrogenase